MNTQELPHKLVNKENKLIHYFLKIFLKSFIRDALANRID